jgi:acetyltransferase-like isoleucine patch superfamily enzyme
MGKQTEIAPSAIIHQKRANLPNKIVIGEYSVIGKKANYLKKNHTTSISSNCVIGSHVIIYEGVIISKLTQVEDFCRIGEKTWIGKNCRIVYGAKIYGHVKIGNNCVIGGFICEDVKIGNNCRIFGELVHKFSCPPETYHDMEKWDKGGEKAPVIHNNVFIGFGAKIVGGIEIGRGAFIFPNAIVTKDVPENTDVKLIDQQCLRNKT